MEETSGGALPEPPRPLTPEDPGYDPALDEINWLGFGIYDRRGNTITTRQWAELTKDVRYVRVALTQVSEDVEVSTVWLGLDHNFTGRGLPLIFETMIFTKMDKPINLTFFDREVEWDGGEMWRWPTEQAAIAGHAQVVGAMFVPDSPTAIEEKEEANDRDT